MTLPGTTGFSWLTGDGEMSQLIRTLNWSRTPLDAVDTWSPALRMMIRFLLANRFPLLLWWGPRYISIYNDAYRPILGTKHPWALGQPVSECWKEIWPTLKPLIDMPFQGGSPTWNEDLFLEINRHGFVEETHFTVAYSPVPDDSARGGIGGVLATVHEITDKIVGERRMAALRDVGARSAEARTAEDACAIAAQTLTAYDKDVPFASFYLLDADARRARLAGSTGVATDSPVCPRVIDIAVHGKWPLAEALRTETLQVVGDLADRFGQFVPQGPWSDRPHEAAVLPIQSNIAHQPAGVLLAGVSPRLQLDHRYRSFYELLAGQIATAIANARVYEAERKRAEALAEIDRAKTVFFSNVSHEFRTPLTLMLGPLEETLSEPGLPSQVHHRIEVAHRNSLRLLKLVNSLLDFSRIEAGRIQATYEPVDLAALTTELASLFRSAIEKAGLELRVDCPALDEPVYVDCEMWEKIVLNLLSNAFKFTFEGHIDVGLKASGGTVELTVRDTGTGIPAEHLPHLFERFRRVEGARARSIEGTGIGLSLVRELAKLHGGSVRVESEVDRGSAFSVTLPRGRAHLPADRIGTRRGSESKSAGSRTYVDEVLHWLPAVDSTPPGRTDLASRAAGAALLPVPRSTGKKLRVLIADDNVDMRGYLRRLLVEAGYEVEAVADGQAALEAVRERVPDLALVDVMMPRLDGFELLNAVRADERTAAVPVIMLSARAGEEARIEGLAAGATDYLIKPFSARELLAHIYARLEIVRLRQEADARAQADFDAMTLLYNVGHRCMRAGETEGCLNEIVKAAVAIVGADKGNLQVIDAATGSLRIAAQQGFSADFLDFFETVRNGEAAACGTSMASKSRTVVEDVASDPIFAGQPSRPVLLNAGVRAVQSTPLVSSTGAVLGMISTHFSKPHRCSERDLRLIDLLARLAADYLARKEAERDSARLSMIVSSTSEAIISSTPDGIITSWNPAATHIFGYSAAEMIGASIRCIVPPDRQPEEGDILARIRLGERLTNYETVHIRKDGRSIHVSVTISPILDDAGQVIGVSKTAHDITERKTAEDRERMLMREVNHRSKNLLGLVQAVARRTAAGNPQDFLQRFDERMLALAASQDVLVRAGWKEVPLDELIRAQLGHFADALGTRVLISGATLSISAAAAQTLGMAVHELATNAAKYGALSNDSGVVTISWKLVAADGQGQSFVISWIERGGPSIEKPTRRGFGSTVTGSAMGMSLNGTVEADYAPGGFSWRLSCPASKVLETANVMTEAAPGRPRKEPPRERPRVLVVEDEALIALEIAAALEEAGFAVLGPANSVAGAMELLNGSTCEGAVLDVNLGQETAEPIALMLVNKGTPFVTITGYGGDQLPPVFRLGSRIGKPLRPTQLVSELRQLLATMGPNSRMGSGDHPADEGVRAVRSR